MPHAGNVALIGMPGSGKSTVGVLLAKHLGHGFIDTDILIQQRAGRTLQEIVDSEGYEHLRELEADVILSVEPVATVIATGGSAVYGEAAMQHLADRATIVWLRADLATIKARLGDWSARGIALPPDQSIEALFAEREPLYARWAGVTVDAGGRRLEDCVSDIVQALS